MCATFPPPSPARRSTKPQRQRFPLSVAQSIPFLSRKSSRPVPVRVPLPLPLRFGKEVMFPFLFFSMSTPRSPGRPNFLTRPVGVILLLSKKTKKLSSFSPSFSFALTRVKRSYLPLSQARLPFFFSLKRRDLAFPPSLPFFFSFGSTKTGRTL